VTSCPARIKKGPAGYAARHWAGIQLGALFDARGTAFLLSSGGLAKPDRCGALISRTARSQLPGGSRPCCSALRNAWKCEADSFPDATLQPLAAPSGARSSPIRRDETRPRAWPRQRNINRRREGPTPTSDGYARPKWHASDHLISKQLNVIIITARDDNFG
jgi:hypothetical protein